MKQYLLQIPPSHLESSPSTCPHLFASPALFWVGSPLLFTKFQLKFYFGEIFPNQPKKLLPFYSNGLNWKYIIISCYFIHLFDINFFLTVCLLYQTVSSVRAGVLSSSNLTATPDPSTTQSTWDWKVPNTHFVYPPWACAEINQIRTESFPSDCGRARESVTFSCVLQRLKGWWSRRIL